jgi:hypothetical protein
VPEHAYAHLIEQMPGKDPDDRVHMAAAIAGRAAAIVTWNLADFPAAALASHGVGVCTPDDYLCGLLDVWPGEVLETVVRLAGEKRRPPMTPVDLIDSFAKAGRAGVRSTFAGDAGRPALRRAGAPAWFYVGVWGLGPGRHAPRRGEAKCAERGARG